MRCRHCIVVAALAMVSAAPAAAQDNGTAVAGLILSAKGNPIPDASVSVAALGRATTSDSSGRFRISGVALGSHLVEVRALGYLPSQQSITVIPGEEAGLEFRLKPAAVTLPEVVVSTSRERERASTTALSVGVIQEQEIRETRGHHPSELMNRTPGVFVSNFGGEGHATAIRQPITTKALYAYLEDGVPIRSTGFFNHNALYEINIPQAGRVEVIKGPGTAIYGSDAVGGVVNAFTREPSATSEAEIFVEGGSSTYLRALGSGSSTFGRNGLRADINVTRADGWRQETPYDRQSGTLRWDLHVGGRTRIKTLGTLTHVNQPGDGGGDIDAGDFQTAPFRTYTPAAFRRVNAARLSSELQVRGERSSFGSTLYARYNELDLLPSWQLSFDPQVWESRNYSVGLLTRWRRTLPSISTSLSSGVDLEYSPGSRLETAIQPRWAGQVFQSYTTGETQYDYEVAFWQASPYAQADVALPGRVHLSAGVRYDRLGYDYENRLDVVTTGTHRRPASTRVSFARISPKFGASWELASNASVFVSYRAAFRAPSESQLFRQGAAVSTVDLKPVRAASWEAGFRAVLGGVVSVEATGYSMRLRDDILTFFDPATGLRHTQNAGATNHRGAEVGIGLAVLDGLRLDGAVSYSRHTYVGWKARETLDYSGNEMELAPRFLGNARVTYRPSSDGSGTIALEWVRLGSYWMDPENTHEYGGHSVFSLYGTIPVASHLELTGRLTNLGNRRFAETSSYNPQQGERFRPGAPRQVYLGAQYRFN